MAYAGQIIDNPITGAHIHAEQEERFEVVSGTMKFRMNGKKIVAGPGETVVVPAGARHKFANGGGEPAVVRVEVRPALRMAELLETTVRLAEEGKTNRKGMPKPVHLALFVRAFEREVRAPFPPPFMVNAPRAPPAYVVRRRGHAELFTARPAYAV